jgi:hypothetical protein
MHQVWRSPQACEQLETLLQHLCEEAPDGEQALIAWWPAFKKRVLVACAGVAKAARVAQGVVGQQRQAALAQVTAALDQVEAVATSQDEAATAAALQQVLQARAAWCEAVAQDGAAARWQRRREWVHHQERPNPAFTSELHGSKGASQQIPPVRSPTTGRLVEGGRPLAQMVAEFWAGVSVQPPVQQQAAAAVLAAVAAQGRCLPPVTAAAVGEPQVEEAEVAAALKRSKSGRAPGLDGLPVEVYRKHKQLFVPLLARLYSAIGVTGQLPQGFTQGVISTLHKSGARDVLSHYRPITLLNSDYRVLANLLARRLRPVQGALIGREQTAFLPGRQIGENIMLLQLLPHALPASSKAVLVFLDFRKAYDTIDRGFLFRLLQLAGLGEGFLQWVQLLLQGTQACACVNGHLSGMVGFQAGVRQGCPLAPQLYLFVAQALLAFLQARGWGVQVGAARVTGCQYADDAQVVLPSIADLPRFLEDMEVFKQACGQGLNHSKTQVLPISRGGRREAWQQVHYRLIQQHAAAHPPRRVSRARTIPPPNPRAPVRLVVEAGGPQQAAPQPVVARLHHRLQVEARVWQFRYQGTQLQERLWFLAEQAAYAQLQHDPIGFPEVLVHGLPLVGAAQALGITHTATGQSLVNWQDKLEVVHKCYAKVAALPLSLFGRAFACSGYALSTMLFAAEFVGPPPQATLQELHRVTARLVDRGLAPASQQRKFAGVRADLLVGHPREGGCGVMPLRQHILARQAMWAIRLLLGDAATPWVHVARHILSPQLRQCPSWQQAAISVCQPEQQLDGLGQRLPQPLQQLSAALAALPPMQDVSAQPLPVSAVWCAQVPLWGNVFAASHLGQPLATRGLEAQFADVAALGTITTVGEAVAATRDVTACTTAQQYQQGVWGFWFAHMVGFAELQHTKARMAALYLALPARFRDPVTAAVNSNQHLLPGPGGPRCADVWVALRGRLGWKRQHGKPITLAKASVRVLTQLQLGPLAASVAQRHGTYLEAASQGLPAQEAPTQAELLGMLRRAWQLPWDNQRKELLWRLVLDGVPTAQRMAMVGQSCACGVVGPGRQHHYWACPVAQAVVAAMQQQLPQQVQLRPVHVWLARPPHRTLHKGVWLVVALAALLAMDHGRRRLCAWALPPKPGQQPAPAPPVDQRLSVASSAAVGMFWGMLADFIGMSLCPPDWLATVPGDHPFLATRVHGEEGVRVLCVRRQPVQQLPPHVMGGVQLPA